MYLLLTAAILAGGYFCTRYLLLRHALEEASLELQEIQRDLDENQILHLTMPDRELEHFLGNMNSILEEIRLERLSYEKREKAFQQQIEHISHDLRTPLTVILGYLRFMEQSEEYKNMSQEQRESLEIVERKARALEHLITEFYDFSRLASQDYTPDLQKTDVCRLLRETFLDHCQLLEQARLQPHCQLPDHPVFVLGDTVGLERIFANLFQNARRYAGSFLYLELKESPDQAVISFINDTKNLSSSETAHLFDRFYMQDETRSQGGTGLGLTIAKSLAEAMHGTLTAELTEDSNETPILILTLSLQLFYIS